MKQVTISVFIPLHTPATFRCDYLLQTVKQLIQRNIHVYLLYYSFSQSILEINQKKAKNFLGEAIGNLAYSPFLHLLIPKTISVPLMKNSIKIKKLFLMEIKQAFLGQDKPVLWCFEPDDADLALYVKKKFNNAVVLYDCVDYFTSLNQIVDDHIHKNEINLINTATYFITNSYALERIKSVWRRPNAVVPQGFDQNGLDSQTKTSKKTENKYRKYFEKIPTPRIGFIGHLAYRIDYDLLMKICRNLPFVSFVFTDTPLHFEYDDVISQYSKKLNKLKTLSNVYLIPPFMNRSALKTILPQIDICMIPYNTAYDFNKYCYPMKLFEYFYMGKPVISTPIEELRRYPKFVKIGKNSTEWEQHIRVLLKKPWPKSYQKEQKILALKNNWENKIELILKEIGVISAKPLNYSITPQK
jgi:hypothetical protein